MTARFTREQQIASTIDRMSASTETSAATAHGMLNAGIVLSFAMPALWLGAAAALTHLLAESLPRR